MKFKLTAVFLILITSIAVPSYSDDVDEAPMSQERYDSLTDGAKAIIEEYGKKDCEDEYDGIFTVLNHAVTKLRVGRNDEDKQTLATVEVLNYGGLDCSIGVGWCGSGGCRHEILVDGVKQSAGQIQGIEEVQLENGEYILVGGLHGSSCDTAGYNYCYVALRWDGERFLWKKP